ncbi:oxidoreductase, short-chain dehydrogenase/reductase family protein [Candidatus Thiomargarita nelsonii]|uniref:Oxidoreductase, short-chain dehydrogenase/reductase family protein n=1 Tax=Candidatus Thiomargarita nelsonii TaxID=1003181 RepID=A0A176RZF9_9GAMM|nr:oxidoreductase, short-chain dehydrogenase/reductase family protein [Candidatus Thiomargarita nelsonii]
MFKTPKSLMSSRPILITGCSSGIGYCVAHALKKRGYSVFATVRQPKDVARLQQEGLESLVLDLSDSQSIFEAVQTVLEQTDGRLYGLFNNGAYGQPGAVEDLSVEALRQQFETNFFGTHELTRQVISAMRRQGEGRIIQNSSVLGLVALPYRGAYNATKFALEGLSDTLRLELAGTGIFISLIEPGPILSQFRANAYKMFKQHIDAEQSIHYKTYAKMEQRLLAKKAVAPFTLPPEAVLKRVIHALESRHPQPRYYVTFPTYLLATLKRLLPHRAMDWVLRHLPE